MHLKPSLPAALFSLALLVAVPAFAASDNKAPAPAKQPDNYPLKTCVVSDEALGSMGEFVNYVHKEPGKPDRIVRFCCDGCIDDFKKDPAKYLKKLDDAAAGKKSAPAAPAKEPKK
jgi:hypothetical protein